MPKLNDFQEQVLSLHPMNQMAYHVGFGMGFLSTELAPTMYCSATQATSHRMWSQGLLDGRAAAEASEKLEAELYAAQDQVTGLQELMAAGEEAQRIMRDMQQIGLRTPESDAFLAGTEQPASTVRVNMKALKAVLAALTTDPSYVIREMQVTRRLHGGTNPIDQLIDDLAKAGEL
ncbi:hypothetical protein GOD54_23560 [Sinorhizobium medicae]|nr:hypothetical protein [Sinorhizobium medicae]